MNLSTLEDLNARLAIEHRIRDGAESLLKLHVFSGNGSATDGKEQLRRQVEDELDAANAKIDALEDQIARINEGRAGSCGLEQLPTS